MSTKFVAVAIAVGSLFLSLPQQAKAAFNNLDTFTANTGALLSFVV